MTRALTFDVRHRHKLGKRQDLTLSPFLSWAKGKTLSLRYSLGRLLVVSHTYRPSSIRLISARRVTRTERKLYEES